MSEPRHPAPSQSGLQSGRPSDPRCGAPEADKGLIFLAEEEPAVPRYLSVQWWSFVIWGPDEDTDAHTETLLALSQTLVLPAITTCLSVALLLVLSTASVLPPGREGLLGATLLAANSVLSALTPVFVRASYIAIRRHDARGSNRPDNSQSTSASQPPTGEPSPKP